MNRFDSLVHVTRNGRWLNGRDDASYQRLMTELDRAQVDRACLVGLAGVVDNDYVMECARGSDKRLVPIAGIRPADYSNSAAMRDDFTKRASEGFAGIKLHPRLHGYNPLDDRCLEAIRVAAGLKLVVFVDTLFRQPDLATVNAADTIDRMAQASDGAVMILLHGGGVSVLEVAEVVRARPALFLDLSFTMCRYEGTSLDADLRWVMQRLDQRVVIGSDMPEYTPSEAFVRARAIAGDIADEKWHNITHCNLERIFSGEAWPQT